MQKKNLSHTKKISYVKKHIMDVIYKKNADLDNENNFGINLIAKEITDGLYLKSKDEYLRSGLKIKGKPVDLTKLDYFDTIKKIADRIKKAKRDRENEVNHGQLYVYLPNFNNFNEDILIANNPPKKVYKYIDVDTKKIDAIEFPDYKKWYEDGNEVWKSTKH